MKILAVEFSSEDRSVAVLDDQSGGAVLSRVCERGGRRALELVEAALSQAGCEREEIECLAVGIGPGSYTGIRGSISLAQGWQLGRGIKLLAVSSAECVAARAREEKIFGRVNVVIDAQRNEFYLAGYEISPEAAREIEPLHLVSIEEVQQLCQAGEAVIGPDAGQVLAQAKSVSPDAATLARLACGRSDFLAGDKLEPIYLRLADFKKAPPRRIIN